MHRTAAYDRERVWAERPRKYLESKSHGGTMQALQVEGLYFKRRPYGLTRDLSKARIAKFSRREDWQQSRGCEYEVII
jgi:hypothetical protein